MSEIEQLIEEYKTKIEFYTKLVAELESKVGITNGELSSNSSEKLGSDVLAKIRSNEFFNKSQPEAAKVTLERAGRPLQTQEIMEAIQKGGVNIGGKNPKAKKQNFYTILARSPEFGLFKRDTWGLKSWPGIKKSKEVEKTDKEPEQGKND